MRIQFITIAALLCCLSTFSMTAESQADGYVETTGSYAEGEAIRGNRYTTDGALKVSAGAAGSSDTELPAPVTLANNMSIGNVPIAGAAILCADQSPPTTYSPCLAGLTDTDDGTVAFSSVPSKVLNLNYVSNGTDWVRLQLGIEDVAETGGGQLFVVGSVRRDTAASSAGTTGDYATLNTDSIGRLWTTGTALEDVAEADGMQLAMVGAVRRDVAATSSGTTGDNSTFNTDALGLLWTRHLDPCSGIAKTHLPIDIVTATTTEITPSLAGASTHYYICSLDLFTAGANNVAIVDDDSDDCGSPTSGINGGVTAAEGFNLVANQGYVKGNGMGTVFKTNGTNRVICIITSAAVQLSGSMQVVAAP